MAKVFEVDEEKGKYKDEKEGAKMSPPTNTLQARGGQMCHVPGDMKKKEDGNLNPGYVLENQLQFCQQRGSMCGNSTRAQGRHGFVISTLAEHHFVQYIQHTFCG